MVLILDVALDEGTILLHCRLAICAQLLQLLGVVDHRLQHFVLLLAVRQVISVVLVLRLRQHLRAVVDEVMLVLLGLACFHLFSHLDHESRGAAYC